jgi:hypothetical protein
MYGSSRRLVVMPRDFAVLSRRLVAAATETASSPRPDWACPTGASKTSTAAPASSATLASAFTPLHPYRPRLPPAAQGSSSTFLDDLHHRTMRSTECAVYVGRMLRDMLEELVDGHVEALVAIAPYIRASGRNASASFAVSPLATSSM